MPNHCRIQQIECWFFAISFDCKWILGCRSEKTKKLKMLPQLLLNVKATNNQADWQKGSKTSPHHHHHHYSTSRIYCVCVLTASGISTIVANASHSDTSIYFVCLHLVLFQQCCRHFELSFSPSPLSLSAFSPIPVSPLPQPRSVLSHLQEHSIPLSLYWPLSSRSPS